MAMKTPRVPAPGDNVHAHHFTMGAGGKGANSAVAIVRLGGRALLVGCVGDDLLGQFELDALQREGVDTRDVIRVPGWSTAVAFIMVDENGENAVLVANRTNETLTGAAVEACLEPHWDTLDAVLVNFEASEAAVRTAVEQGRAHGVPVIVDAGPAMGYGPATWSRATVLTPNLKEAEALTGHPLPDDSSAGRAARALLEHGPAAVVIKQGNRGALAVTRDRCWRVPAFAVNAVDMTGAGDAFTAAMALALAEGETLQVATRRAVAAGAVAVTRFGTLTAMPSRAEVEDLLARTSAGRSADQVPTDDEPERWPPDPTGDERAGIQGGPTP